jgi:hypothetical protein
MSFSFASGSASRKVCIGVCAVTRRRFPVGAPRRATTGAAFRRAHPSHHCWRTSICAGLCLGWKKLGLETSLGTRLVIYSDDLVILCRRGNAEAALHRLREITGKLKLTVNEDKTRICTVLEGEFDFLGFSVLQAHTERSSSWTDQRVDKLRER